MNRTVSSFRKVTAPGTAEHLQLRFAFLQHGHALVFYVMTVSAEGSTQHAVPTKPVCEKPHMSNLKRAQLFDQEQKSAENKACLKPGCCSFIAPLFGWYGGSKLMYL